MLTAHFRNLLLNAGPDTVFVGLFTGGAPGTGTELAPATIWGAEAVRPSVDLAASVDGARHPEADTEVGTFVSGAEITHVGWYDAATGGNLLGVGVHERIYAPTDTCRIPAANPVFVLEN